MRFEELSDKYKEASFEFFYWFSRFEFALKENKLLKNVVDGTYAEAGWVTLVEKYEESYIATEETILLIKLHPQRQIVCETQGLRWKPVGTGHCKTELCKVVAMLLTVRNNLFHGGKHGNSSKEEQERDLLLINTSKTILDQFAAQFDLECDYTGYY